MSFVFSLHRALSYNGFCSIISCFVSFIFKYNLTLVHQVELSHQDAELRLLEVFFHKIYKVTGELLDFDTVVNFLTILKWWLIVSTTFRLIYFYNILKICKLWSNVLDVRCRSFHLLNELKTSMTSTGLYEQRRYFIIWLISSFPMDADFGFIELFVWLPISVLRVVW